jgi:hypothetical protein
MSVILTIYPDNNQGANPLNQQNVSPWRPPEYYQITYEYTGPPQDFGAPNEPPSGCGIGLTISPCHPPDTPHSIPGPATLPLVVLGVALIGWLHRRVVS